MPDSLSDRYAELLTGSYDCVDRIVLNAFFRMGHGPGGFRVWWRALTGSEETLDNTHLMRMAGRFSRRIHGYAKANGIPVVHCPAGERKHELAEEYLAKTNITQGLFLILVGRAQAPVWDVSVNHHIEPKKPMPYVNHYSFHILDPEWGHITIKISGHPPFPAQVILNGHEYVACQARKAGISFTKEGNCFTQISDAAGLAKIADTLSGQQAIGRLNQACERWIYTTCLCFALELEEQKRSGFRYQYSNYQVEYSRNLIFEIGGHMDQVFQALIDRSRVPLDLETIKTILGYQRRPRYRQRKSKSAQWEVAVEKATYDLFTASELAGQVRQRESFSLYTGNKAAAAARARDIYTGLVSKGWQATREQYKFAENSKAKSLATVADFFNRIRETSAGEEGTLEEYFSAFRLIVAESFGIDGGKQKYDYRAGGQPAMGGASRADRPSRCDSG